MTNPLAVTGGNLTIEDVVGVARGGLALAPLDDAVRKRMDRRRGWLDAVLAEGRHTIYGINTGFGGLAHTPVGSDQMRRLSRNCVTSCTAGVGAPLPEEVVRAMMVIRANVIAQAVSAARPLVAETLIEMLNRGVVPVVPRKGSLGASGDLAPMSHIALVLSRGVEEHDTHCGEAWYEGERLPGDLAMERAGIGRVLLEPKEGVSLTNGTDFMVGQGALLVHDARAVHQHAMIAAAMSIEAVRARVQSIHPAYHAAAGQPGQMRVAARMTRLLRGSTLAGGDPARVQDAYSLRCVPQVLGPGLDAVEYIAGGVTRAINAVTDNPLVVPADDDADDWQILSGGNFHGEGPAFWLDYLAIVMTSVANISDRRIFRLLDPKLNEGLPAMLVHGSGVDTGLMVAQYTSAALVSDCKTLAHPDSVDSIPTSADQEDYVSMGANGARHAAEVLENVRKVVAIELLVAAQAIDMREGGVERMAPATRAAYDLIRERVPVQEHDRPLSPGMDAVDELVRSGELLTAVERALAG